MPDWRVLLASLMLAHGVSTIILRTVPVLAPNFVLIYGWPEAYIGALATVSNFAMLVLMATGTGVLKVIGSARAVQLGLATAAFGGLLLISPAAGLALLACVLIGIGYAPFNPAANDILQRISPPQHRTLSFSLKQSSVPAGGMAAGLLLPVISERFGIQAAILATFGLALLVAVSMQGVVARLNGQLPNRGRWSEAISVSHLTSPIRALLASGPLVRIALVGHLLAVCQGVWFVYLTLYLVVELGYALTTAGTMFALMQGASVFGRVFAGWCADRLGAGRPLLYGAGLSSAVVTVLLAQAGSFDSDLLLWVIVFVGGFAVSSWNGVHIAECLRHAEYERIYEVSAGTALLVTGGIMVGPLVFSVLLAVTGSWSLGLLIIAGFPLLSLVSLALSRS